MKDVKLKQVIFLLFISLLTVSPAHAQAPDHFYNAKENLKPSDYIPGSYPEVEDYRARAVYQQQKSELIEKAKKAGKSAMISQGIGEITFSAVKNESAEVLGYFRNYFAVAETEDVTVQRMEMIIDLNSLDTGVPGRDNRIMQIFFKSMMPKLGTAVISFNNSFRFDLSEASGAAGASLMETDLKGKISLNGVDREFKAKVSIENTQTGWNVKTVDPIELLISDFGYNSEIYELMKECNHKSIGNLISVNVDLYFK